MPLALAALLVALAAPEAARAGTDLLPRSRFLGCETASIGPGDTGSGWTLVEGFEPAGGQDPSAWAGPRASLLLLIGRPERRQIRIVARAERRNVRLTLLLNGVEVGSSLLRQGWHALRWPLPADAARAGPNLLEFRTERAGRARPRASPPRAQIREVALLPRLRCARAASEALEYQPDTPIELWPGWFSVAPATPHPAGELEIAFTGGPGAALRASCFSPAGVRQVGTLVSKRRRVRDHLALPEACGTTAGLVLASSGKRPLQLVAARASDGAARTWRQGIRLGAALSIVASLAAIVLVAWKVSRRTVGRWTPWLDALAVVSVALALRVAFLQLYPYPGVAGDTGEYLAGARKLAVGGASLLGESRWHAWQTYLRPPGYYLFLAAFTGPQGPATATVIYLQALFSALAAGFTYLIARQLFGRAAALAAGLLFALHVESIATCSRILSEPLFMIFMLPGLAALARLSRSPSWRLAALAGVLFGVAALIRSGPVQFALLAGLLLVVTYGFRSGSRLAGALVGGVLLVALPWSIRNSLVEGRVLGLETVSVANLLQDAPQHGFFPSADLDLETASGRRVYRQRMSHANANGEIDGQRSRVMRTVLIDNLRHPERIVRSAGGYFGLMPERYLSWVLREQDAHRVAWLTDLINGQLLVVFVLGFAGLAWHARDSGIWPLALWFLLTAAVIIVLFHAMPRYRLPTVPVLMVLAGATIARALDKLERRRAPSGDRQAPSAGR